MLMQDQPQSGQQQQQSQQNPLEPPLFSVNKNALKGEEEMRRMFGRDVVRMRHQEDEAADLGATSCTMSHKHTPRKLMQASAAATKLSTKPSKRRSSSSTLCAKRITLGQASQRGSALEVA